MSQPTHQAINLGSEGIVETNNFHQVINKFNDSGDLMEKTTGFSIECQICLCKDLALMVPDVGTEDSHEQYVVLPRCGHGFGSDCLQQWIRSQHQFSRKCPTCRSPVDCMEGHSPRVSVLCSRRKNSQKTREDIEKIRSTLGCCSQCAGQGQNHPRDNAHQQNNVQQRDNAQRPEGERLQDTQGLERAEARQRAIQTIMGEGSRMERRNSSIWATIEYDLSRLHLAGQERNQRERFNMRNGELFMERSSVEDAISRARYPGARHDAEHWERIGRRLSDIQEMAEERNERERRYTAIAEQVTVHITALQALLSEATY
ncbi:hypothetical protein F4678DRAFT_465477 [Xylaria arbuscula]|nr:hypothetical protein F4678DRAFT_465477 [Xylaria arbuscula]